ncbi:MAG: type II toxin-antitoxin system VapC family toxin [Gemmatimonadetes bacterium]|mgnify:FL=1|nr:type II toxin-antitoxin system VapC family toxin [Gemmatimonadota bacterium]MBT4611154.1 type II toxin-antitoxin system VapC family toxin [Gemmatimonadota bacterium]MBT5055184.1 type II toxin-antitoxin system VapC family toxin [Gemmatimonadota bacterium]MBT5145323.1 type II toxin-antitoxin system VapC family toxin [Gemmatimonadota bacterium]MBT5591511.1 type II toxin-antitoxin system VapC family toxin [Gemmatimonadota bacterium]
MNVVDSSGWLEYLADGENAGFFSTALEAQADLVVPSLSIYEVFKRILQQASEDQALQAVAAMQQGLVVDLSASLSLAAAKISIDHHLPLADSVILATARAHQATLWTQDADLEGLSDVRYVEKR